MVKALNLSKVDSVQDYKFRVLRTESEGAKSFDL